MSRKRKQQRMAAADSSRAQASHAPASKTSASSVEVLPELPEPQAVIRNVPIWLIVLLAGLLYWADMYVMEHGADVAGKTGPFPITVYDPFGSYSDLVKANPVTPEQEEHNKGQQVFNFVCVQCHQANGQGLPGQYPPLAGSEWVQAEGPANMVRIVLNGLSGPIDVKGQSFNNQMPPWKATLTDEQIAHVISFVRKEWGNSASRATVEEVKKIREQLKDRDDPFNAQELKTLPVKVAGN